MIEFHNTKLGRRFIESTMPRIADSLERIAARMEALKEQSGAPGSASEALAAFGGGFLKIYQAMKVVRHNPEISEFIKENDPKAWEQITGALDE